MKKKLLIIIGAIVLVVAVGFLMRNVGAGKTPKRPITIISAMEFDRWFGDGNSALTGREEAGSYYFQLLCDLRIDKTAVVNNGHTVSLDMNGHTITNQKSAKIQAFSVTEGASLTLLQGTVKTAGADVRR